MTILCDSSTDEYHIFKSNHSKKFKTNYLIEEFINKISAQNTLFIKHFTDKFSSKFLDSKRCFSQLLINLFKDILMNNMRFFPYIKKRIITNLLEDIINVITKEICELLLNRYLNKQIGKEMKIIINNILKNNKEDEFLKENSKFEQEEQKNYEKFEEQIKYEFINNYTFIDEISEELNNDQFEENARTENLNVKKNSSKNEEAFFYRNCLYELQDLSQTNFNCLVSSNENDIINSLDSLKKFKHEVFEEFENNDFQIDRELKRRNIPEKFSNNDLKNLSFLWE